MKLLTLNTHSRPEACEAAIETLSAWMLSQNVDIVALQEVNQRAESAAAEQSALSETGYRPPRGSEIALKQDNYAFALAKALCRGNGGYRWCCLPFKRGYDRYDEGLALFWRGEAEAMDIIPLSDTQDETDWRRRMALGIRCGAHWFYSLHTSRYDDAKEPFLSQWRRLQTHLEGKSSVFLMGDFNCPADRSGEGYDRMIADGWRDTFTIAQLTEGYRTVGSSIDGWRDVKTEFPQRMDFILTNQKHLTVYRCETVFDGWRENMISDHCGLFCWIWEESGYDRSNV